MLCHCVNIVKKSIFIVFDVTFSDFNKVKREENCQYTIVKEKNIFFNQLYVQSPYEK